MEKTIQVDFPSRLLFISLFHGIENNTIYTVESLIMVGPKSTCVKPLEKPNFTDKPPPSKC